jgi:hypothetical protein
MFWYVVCAIKKREIQKNVAGFEFMKSLCSSGLKLCEAIRRDPKFKKTEEIARKFPQPQKNLIMWV